MFACQSLWISACFMQNPVIMKLRTSRPIMICLACMLWSGIAGGQGRSQKSDAGVVATLSVTGCLVRMGTRCLRRRRCFGEAAGRRRVHADGRARSIRISDVGFSGGPTSAGAQALPAAGEQDGRLRGACQSPRENRRHALRRSRRRAHHWRSKSSIRSTRETNLPAQAETASYDGNLVDVSALTMVARSCAP